MKEKKSFTKVISLQSNSVDFRVQIAVFELEVGLKKTVLGSTHRAEQLLFCQAQPQLQLQLG